MSNTALTQSPRQLKFGYKEQTVYGTAEADAAAFTEVDCAPFVVNRDIKLFEVQGSHGRRQQHQNDLVVFGKACIPTFKVNGVVKKAELADILAAYFQSVTEGALTPFSKVHTLHASQPDFLADAGFFYTWIVYDPIAARSIKVADCIMKSLKLSIPADGAAPVTFEAEWAGLGLAPVTADPSGTWTPNTNTGLFYRTDLDIVTINFGAGALNFRLMEGEITLSRDLIGVGHNGTGGFDVVHLANATQTAKLKVVKDTDANDAYTNQVAGTPIDLRIGWGNATPGTDDGDFNIAAHAVIEGPNGLEPTFDEPMGFQINCRLVAATSTEPITITQADAIDKAW